MSDKPPVLRLSYSDIKTVKTRGVFQVVLEGAIEGMGDAIALLGAPIPGNEVWVAIVRLKEAPPAADKPEALPSPKKGTLAQQAGILCNEPAFQKWTGTADAEGAAAEIREHCGVTSRRELDTHSGAGAAFKDMRLSYEIWLKDIA